MPIRTISSRVIEDAAVVAADIAAGTITKAKIDADTRLGLQNDSIILDGTDGASANKGDFLILNGTDGSSTNADDRILFDETFVDKIGLFNINTLGSGGQALKVNSAGSAFEFGAAGGLVKLSSITIASGSEATEGFLFANVFSSTYKNYKIYYNIREKASTANATNGGLLFRFGSGGSVGTTGSTTIKHTSNYMQADTSTNGAVYGDGYDIGTLCQNMASNEDAYVNGFCEVLNPQVSTDPMTVYGTTIMHGSSNANYFHHSVNIATANTSYDTISFMLGVSGGGSGGSLNHTTTKFESFGYVTVYGIIE